MRLNDLQLMSDEMLNKLAAVKILWGGIENVPSDDWKPCSDMNDTIKLLNELNEIEMLDYAATCADLTGHPETTNYNLGCLVGILKLSPKQRTIAAILAKG